MQKQVAENIVTRALERANGTISPKNLKTALVVQGGTLRAVASCGAVAALNSLGLTNAFDTVYGGSSGAINAAYFLSHQAALAVTAYLEDANSSRFLNLFRFYKMLDLDFLFNEVVFKLKKHDVKSFINHPSEFKVVTTNLNTTKAVWFSSKNKNINIYDAIKASCALPVFYRKSIKIEGSKYIDGCIKEPMPIITPLTMDYTDILVMMSRDISFRHTGKIGPHTKFLFEPLIKQELNKIFYNLYRERWKLYNMAVNIIESGIYCRSDGHSIRIGYICPDPEDVVGNFEKNREFLGKAAYSSWRNTYRFFDTTYGSTYADFARALTKSKESNVTMPSPIMKS
jgi:predicted patatin/cPLA2 family phospholipase